jgi:Zn-dependent protease
MTMVLVPFLTYSSLPVNSLVGFVTWASLVILLFGSVLLHELGHALTARVFGIRTLDIVLTPIGGIARVTEMPKKPKQEIAIAAAGPLVSLSLAAIAFLLFIAMPFIPFLPSYIVEAINVLFVTNLMLAVFNLVPALPMDGGRVLRGILALKRDHLSATRIAAGVGRWLAVAGGIGALWTGNLNLGLISVFIYFAAGSELRAAEMRAAQEKMREQGGNPFNFPFGIPRTYSWTWSSGRPGASGQDRNTPYTDERNGWSNDLENREDRDVVVISGKAEIIDPKIPKK